MVWARTYVSELFENTAKVCYIQFQIPASVQGRTFNWTILDMFELGVTDFVACEAFTVSANLSSAL